MAVGVGGGMRGEFVLLARDARLVVIRYCNEMETKGCHDIVHSPAPPACHFTKYP
jgi:hypothetical protein